MHDAADGAVDQPWCSVVVCTYNRADRVLTAVRSVLDQTWRDLELVVVDDGSTDDTAAVIGGVDDERLRYVSRENGGLSRARNSGIECSTGRFVAFLDDDDTFEPTCLEEVADAVGADRLRAVVSWGAMEDEGGQTRIQRPTDLGPAFEGYRALARAGTFAVDRRSLDDVGRFDPETTSNHQTELFLRLMPYCRSEDVAVLPVDRPLTRINIQPAPLRPRNEPRRLYEGAVRLIDRYEPQLERDPELLARYLATAGVAAARAGEIGDARSLLRRAALTTTDRSNRWRNHARWAATLVGPIARRLWRSGDYAPSGAGDERTETRTGVEAPLPVGQQADPSDRQT